MDQTGNAMAQVMKAMKAAGIRENDMQTVELTCVADLSIRRTPHQRKAGKRDIRPPIH